MMVKQGQAKQAVMIELVLVLILAYALTYSQMHHPIPVETRSSVHPFVDVQAPVPSWTFSAAPDTKPAQAKAKMLPHLVKSTPVADPVPSPIVAEAIHDVAEPAPMPAPKEASIPAPEAAAAYVSKPVAAPAPKTVAEPAPIPQQAPASKEALVATPEVTPVPASKEALVAVPEPAPVPVLKTFPTPAKSPTQATPSEPTSPAASLVTGTTAALVLAPFVAPVSLIVGIAVAIFTPSASQLGQVAPAPKPKTGPVPNTGSSSDY